MGKEMFVIATYDISDDKRRLKVMKAMKNFGPRVQKSVFEFNLDADRLGKMKETCEKLIDKKEDSVRFYKVCRECKSNTEVMGWGAVTEDEEFYVI